MTPLLGLRSLLVLLALISLLPFSLALTFPRIMDSNMVLQRAPQSSRIWGTADLNTQLTLTMDSSLTLSALASSDGSFEFLLPPQSASSSHTLTVKSSTGSRTFSNVAFGDVYICSGQSNMSVHTAAACDSPHCWLPLSSSIRAAVCVLCCASNAREMGVREAFDADEAITDSIYYPDLRLFTINKTVSTAPMNDTFDRFPASLGSSWLPSSPTSVNGTWYDDVFTFYGYFSAVCFYSGRDLYQRLGGKVPIGLIETCWSGTRIATWSSPEALAQCNASVEVHEDGNQGVAAEQMTPIGAPVPSAASVLWYGMWAAIVRFPITGVLWY